MSVLGEFRRIAADAASCLRDLDSAAARDLANEIQAAIPMRPDELSRGAAQILELVEGSKPDELAEETSARARVLDDLDRLRMMCRVVLGCG